MSNCERCLDNKIEIYCLSMFNTEAICMPCKKIEQDHPMYSIAQEIEATHVRLGNFNYKGIGMPEDYSQWVIEYTKMHKKNELNDDSRL